MNGFHEWLKSGATAPFKQEERGDYNAIIRVPFDDNFDYLFNQRLYREPRIERDRDFKFAGIYCKKDGLLYDVQYDIQKLDADGYARSEENLSKQLQDEVRRIIEATIANDRRNLKVSEVSGRNKENIDYFVQYTAIKEARERYLDIPEGESLEPFQYVSKFRADRWTEQSFLEYILAPAEYAERIAAEYIETHQEDILYAFLMGDAVAAAYAGLMASPECNVHTVKKIHRAVMAADAKSVTVTMRRGDKELTFKCEARMFFEDCTDKYYTWHVEAAGRRELERTFGRGNDDFRPHEIVRITYGRNTLYEVQNG